MARVPDCHPDRKHVGLGLCRECYTARPEYKERARERARQKYATPEGKQVLQRARKKYMSTEKGKQKTKQTNAEYRKSEARKQSLERYNKSEKGLIARRRKSIRYAKTSHGRGKIRIRERIRYASKKSSRDHSREHYEEVERVYKECPKHMSVDHIIPLTHDLICGLNLPWNLQYLTKSDNSKKNNKWDGTYDNEGWRAHATHQSYP